MMRLETVWRHYRLGKPDPVAHLVEKPLGSLKHSNLVTFGNDLGTDLRYSVIGFVAERHWRGRTEKPHNARAIGAPTGITLAPAYSGCLCGGVLRE